MKFKKIIAMVLCLAMVLSTMGTVAFAEDATSATVTPCYTDANSFWGEAKTNSSESLAIEIYEGETKIASTSLNNVGGIIDGDVYVTWHINFGENNDEYWNVEWAEGYPKYDMNPTAVKLFADGTEVAENDVQFNGPDNLNKIVAIAEGFTGGVKAYTSLEEAVGDFNGRKVNVVRNVTESIESFNGCTLTTNVEGGVTIDNTYDDWVYANDFNIGNGVNVKAANFFYETDGVNTVEGTLEVAETLYHGYDAKTTVNNGGKIAVGGTTILRYNKTADAGLYIYGDGDDSTVEFDCDYYIGTYSGTFYAENANIEAGYYLLKNSYDNETYADVDLTLDNSSIEVVGTTDGQDSFIIDDKASVTLKNGSAIEDVRDFNILAGTDLTLDMDGESSIKATNVSVAKDVPFKTVENDDGTIGVVEILPVEVTTYEELIDALEGDALTIIMKNDIVAKATQSNNYAKAGINILNGETLDGNGYALTLSGLNETWAHAISTTGGTIKNLTINSGFRGVFVNHNSDYSAPVYLENVIIDGPVYTISCDQGTGKGLTATNCTFNGWTSYAATIGNVVFNNCKFGEGSGYAFCRPYVESEFNGCDFEKDYEFDAARIEDKSHEFNECKYDGKDLSAGNGMEMFTSGGNIKVDGKEANLVANPVAKIGLTTFASLKEAVEAAKDGDVITLIKDAEIDTPITIKNNITIDGNGHKITQSAECNNNIALLYFEGSEENVLNITVKNATFDGLKVGAAIRTLYANMDIDNCVFQNSEHTVGQGLVRLTYGTANITNSKFLNNNCSMGISFNWDGNGLATDTLTVDNCEFTGNTANKTALIYYVKGMGCEIKNSEFKDNDVNCANNGAVIYLGFQENCSVTGCLFEKNDVVDSSTSTRVAGAIFFGYEAEISGNAFINNTASNANGDALGQSICTSTYYECEINLSENYFGGQAPVEGKDYYIQHKTGDGEFVLNNYYESYTTDSEGNIVLDGRVDVNNVVATNGENYYYSLQDAIYAANAGDVIVLSGDVEETVTVNAPASTYSMRNTAPAVTIDLAGYTLNGSLMVLEGANVNIINGTIINTNKNVSAVETLGNTTFTNVNITSKRHAIRVDGNGTAVIDGGIYKLNNTENMSIYTVNASANAVVTIKDGTFIGDGGLNEASAAVASRDNAVVTIYGGTYSNGVPNTLSGKEKKNIVVYHGIYDQDPSDYLAKGYVATVNAVSGLYEVSAEGTKASEIKVVFEEVASADEDIKVYNIVLKADSDINEFASAELTFINNSELLEGGVLPYVITPAEDMTLSTVSEKPGYYGFAMEGDTEYEISGDKIILGKVTFTGYGNLDFRVKDGIVNATTVMNNLVKTYVVGGSATTITKGNLIINTDILKEGTTEVEYPGIIDGEIKVPTRTLTINLDFPNEVTDNAFAYQDMKVEITGNIDGVNKTVTYNLGTNGNFKMVNGSYVVTDANLVLNNAYTVTVSGAGYRTARYTVTMTEDKTLRFWNNVMDEAQFVEIGKESSKVNVTFLAGDIVKDNKINIYDLSAVVSYFGTATNTASYDAYAKYDLNRDGVIDSKDVAYVLVSWNK